MLNILIINGPNLNLLGEREKDKYGNTSFEEIKKNFLSFSKKHNINLSFFQSNIEGEIVNEIQKARDNQNCLIINAGGYTHTSVAIHDALKILKIPIIELHITNIYKTRNEIKSQVRTAQSHFFKFYNTSDISFLNQSDNEVFIFSQDGFLCEQISCCS